jgi:hypothetical protein
MNRQPPEPRKMISDERKDEKMEPKFVTALPLTGSLLACKYDF